MSEKCQKHIKCDGIRLTENLQLSAAAFLGPETRENVCFETELRIAQRPKTVTRTAFEKWVTQERQRRVSNGGKNTNLSNVTFLVVILP